MSNFKQYDFKYTGDKIYTPKLFSLSMVCILQRTSDSLNEGLPIKMVKQKFQRK